MSQVKTYGRYPTLGEVKEYYAREDVLTFLNCVCKKRKVIFSFKAEPSLRSEAGTPPLEPHNIVHLRQIIRERIEENMHGKADDARPLAYPSFHGLTKKGDDTIGDFVMEADCEGWRRSFVDVRGAIEILNDFNVPYIAKFSGHRSLHVMIPREAFPEVFNGAPIARGWESLGKRLRNFFGKFAQVRRAHGTGGLLRLPYSLNENTGLVSLPILYEAMDDFRPWEAMPHLVEEISLCPFDVSEEDREKTSQFLHAALIEKRITPLKNKMWRIKPKGDLDKYAHLLGDASAVPIMLDSDNPTQRAEAAWKLMVSGGKVPEEVFKGYKQERNADVRWFIAEAMMEDERALALLSEGDKYAADSIIDASVSLGFLEKAMSKTSKLEFSPDTMMNVNSIFERSVTWSEEEIIRHAELVAQDKAFILLKCASVSGGEEGWETARKIASILERRFPSISEFISQDIFENIKILEREAWWEAVEEKDGAMQALIAAGERATDALILAIGSTNHWTRRFVLSILCAVGDPKSIPALVNALGSPSGRIRKRAMWGILKFDQKPEELKELLIEAAASDNPNLQANATTLLRIIYGADSEALEVALESLEDVNPKVRRSSVKSLGKIGGPKAIDGLKHALSDENADVAINAAFALSDMGDEGAAVLKAALKDDRVQTARCAAHALLASLGGLQKDVPGHQAKPGVLPHKSAGMGDTSGVHLVIDAFNDEGWDVWCTPFTLAASGDKRAVDALLKTVASSLHTENISSKALRAVKALGDCADERAVDVLKTVMYKRLDRKSRKAAVTALQKIGTEKAVRALLEALAGESKALRQQAQHALVRMGTEILPQLNMFANQVEGKARGAVENIIDTSLSVINDELN